MPTLSESRHPNDVARKQVEEVWLHIQRNDSTRNISIETRDSLLQAAPTDQPIIPHAYQTEGIAYLQSSNRLLADECGLGKTLQAILAVPSNPAPILVVCPKRAKDWWASQLDTLAPPDDTYLISLDAGKLPVQPTELNHFTIQSKATRAWVIMHYEGVRLNWESLSQVEWGCIILDEAHRIKNRQTQTAVKLKRIKASHKIALTATPMEQGNVADLWSILNWLDSKTFHSYWKFFEYFVDFKPNYWGGYEIKGIDPKHSQELSQLLSGYVLRRTKLDVAPQLPPKIIQTIPLQLTESQRKLYNEVAKQTEIDLMSFTSQPNSDLAAAARASLPGGRADGGAGVDKADQPTHKQVTSLFIKNTLARIVRLQQVVNDPQLIGVHGIPSSKLEWVEDWLRDNPTEIVVVMSQFRQTAINLAKKFDGACVVGGSPVSEATRFLDGSTRLLVGTIAAAGEALNLQRASTLIFIEQIWSTIKMQQAIDRIHRINITEPKHIIMLDCYHTVDQLVAKALARKWSDAELVYELVKNGSEYL